MKKEEIPLCRCTIHNLHNLTTITVFTVSANMSVFHKINEIISESWWWMFKDKLSFTILFHNHEPLQRKKNLFGELSILKVIKYSVFLHAWNSSFWMELHLKGMHLESKIWFLKSINTHTMMLLMGMWINRTKNPINPMMANPIAVAIAIFWNSNLEKRKNWLGYILSYLLNKLSTYDKY